MSDPQIGELRSALWGNFYSLGNEMLEALRKYLPQPGTERYGYIFKLSLHRYREEDHCLIVGIRLFGDDLYILVRDDDGAKWEYVASDGIEFSYSISRIDILMWIVSELSLNFEKEQCWYLDDTGVVPTAEQ